VPLSAQVFELDYKCDYISERVYSVSGSHMKTVGIREAKACLSECVARAQQEDVVLMRHGKPVAILHGVDGRSLESLLSEDSARAPRRIPVRHHYRNSNAEAVGQSLVAYGAPLAGWDGVVHMSLEAALVAGLGLARENATVLRVLPVRVGQQP